MIHSDNVMHEFVRPTQSACQAHLCIPRHGRRRVNAHNRGMALSPDPLTYQKHLRAWRKLRGLTLEQVGEAMDVSHTSISRWEKGEMEITSKALVAFCRLYDVTPEMLLNPPSEAEMSRRLEEMRPLLEKMDDEAFNHVLYVAKRAS